jgi:hypothetical protein
MDGGYVGWAKTINCPIYLRIGYEFDGPHNQLEPEEYKEAYKRFVDITREEGVNNVAFVWHSYAAPPYKGYALGSWYPGDDYVDWVAVSLFGHMYGPDPGLYGDAVFDFAKTHKKPVMVAESSPIYGIFDGDVRSWNTWFVNAGGTARLAGCTAAEQRDGGRSVVHGNRQGSLPEAVAATLRAAGLWALVRSGLTRKSSRQATQQSAPPSEPRTPPDNAVRNGPPQP